MVNYNFQTPNIGQQFMGGYAMGQEIMAKRAAQQRQAEMQEEMGNFATQPNKTAEDYQRLMTKYPEMSKQIDQSLQAFNAQQKQAKINQMMSMYAPLKSGNTEAAKARLDEMIAAYRNSGQELEAKNMETVKENIDLDPKGAETAAEMFLFQALGAEDFKKFTEARGEIGEERRAAELQPEELKLKKAEVVKSGIDAGLTQQETLKTIAATKKLDAETQKIILETEAMQKQGALDPEKIFEQERKLAKEYQVNTKNFTDVQEAYRRIQAAEDNAAGDLSLIFSYMKMLDPGSVVREGEFANAQNAAGVPQRVLNLYNKLLEGERLGDKQRKQFRGQANGLFKAASKREGEVRSGLEKVIKNYGLNSENIFIGREPEKTQEEKPQVFRSIAEAEAASANMKKGTRIQVGNEVFEVE